jgi:hypothetical protein
VAEDFVSILNKVISGDLTKDDNVLNIKELRLAKNATTKPGN